MTDGHRAHGTEDEIVPYEQGVSLAEALDAELLTLPNAGHNDVLSKPHWPKFAARVQSFLKESRRAQMKKDGQGG